jgi:DNA-binding LacI/PurR family transcriptional regulator
VLNGDYTSGQLIGTELELARQENVARMTIRRAVELLVSEGLIVRRAGKGVYVREQNVITRTIHVVAGNLSWEPSILISRGTQSIAGQQGIQVQLYDAYGDMGRDLTMLKSLPTSSVDGAVVLSLHSKQFTEVLYQLKSEDFPFVLVDHQVEGIDISSVTANNYGGGYQVGQELLKFGHRRIGFIGDIITSTVRDRLAGLRDAIADAGLPFDRTLIYDLKIEPLADWSDEIDRCTRELMDRPNRPTAIFFSCDAVARTAYRTLNRMGLQIPKDVSVVGFDDDPLAEWLTPPLATVRQPFLAIGQEAMNILLQLMIDPKSPAEHCVLPVTFIPRESVAAPAGIDVVPAK